MSFSEQLKKAMIERNITQAELSALTGIGKSSISQYVSGKNEPKEIPLNKIADALDCSVAFLNGTTTCPDMTADPSGLKCTGKMNWQSIWKLKNNKMEAQ